MSFYKEVPGRKTTLESTLKFDTTPTAGSTNPVTSDGVNGAVLKTSQELEEIFFANMDVPASTLRFSFGDVDYDPTTDTTVASKHNTADRAGGGTPAGYGGTWTKLKTKFANIWDYTYVDNTLLSEFDNGNYSAENPPATRFWNDVEHNPIKIIASNLAGCTSIKRAFQGCWAITEVWDLDTSNVSSTALMFSYCKNLVKVPDVIDCTNATEVHSMFQHCWKLAFVNNVVLPDTTEKSLNAQNMFQRCESLVEIREPLNFKSITNMQNTFVACINLSKLTILNTSRVNNFDHAFSACKELSYSTISGIDTSSATNMSGIFSGEARHALYHYKFTMKNITEVPAFNFSSVTSTKNMFYLCDIQTIDATKLASLSGSVNVNEMFSNNRNCKSGILDAYAVLDAVDSSHTDCFLNCGIDTEEGRAELEQIPASWGGLAP
jgi:hypothetical protein